jgi:hypothetical protein
MTLNEIVTLTLSIIILVLLLLVYCFRVELQGYELQFKMLELQTKQQAIEFEDAKKQADAEMAKMKKQSKIILASNVSKNCNDAVKWAIGQANEF